MPEPIISRQSIAEDADAAARRFVLTGEPEENPFVSGIESHREWQASFERSLLKWSAPDAEASA
jgi:hypothetical protein